MVSQSAKFAVRWRRAGVGVRLSLFVIGAILFGLLIYWQRPQEDAAYLGNNLLVFTLLNLNIAVLCILIFLVGRNVIKLVFDRRRAIFGSKLRMRLVIALVALTLVPTSILFVLASDLLTRAMQGWFSNQVESSVSGAVEVAKLHYVSLEQSAQKGTQQIIDQLESKQLTLAGKESLRIFLEEQREKQELHSIFLLSEQGEEFLAVRHATADIEDFEAPAHQLEALLQAVSGGQVTLFEEQGANQFIRVYSSVNLQAKPYVLVTTFRIRPELTHAMAVVNSSYKEYEQLKFFRHPLRSGYLLSLAMITGLILFAAIWFGFYIAREISVPIQRLAEGTKAVAKGNYDFQIRVSGDDEISFLVRSFNKMTRDLRNSIRDAESRRLFIETILSNLAVGVIALDSSRRITSINSEATKLCNIDDERSVVGRKLSEIIPEDALSQIEPLLVGLAEGEESVTDDALEQELRFMVQGRELQVLCTAGTIHGNDQEPLGAVLLFDDITELSKAQHMTAWREAARRIAHEIKNPLTPIQLSAQRLERFVERGQLPDQAREAAQTVVENVDSIKRLANEFSRFARMPTAEFELSNLNVLVSDTLAPFIQNDDSILFQFIAESRMPDIMIDREQIRRMVMNLIDNAVGAIEKQLEEDPKAFHKKGEQPRIVVKTRYEKKRKIALLEVSDNGPGIPDIEKTRIFQPYFTTKTKGTGLGLAIVSSAISDHQGQIRVHDNTPYGTKFIVELPVVPKHLTQRRFAA